MSTNMKAEAQADLGGVMADIAALKRDIAAIAAHVTRNASGMTADAASAIGQEAGRVYDSVAAQGEKSAKAIGKQIEEQPVASLLIAFAAGFIGSRLLSAAGR